MADGRKPKGRHPEKALSPAFVRKTTKPGRYYDGNGLFLKIDSSGAKRWGQRLVIHGRQRTLGLGGYALVSLAEAREAALENRKIARAGGDPLVRRSISGASACRRLAAWADSCPFAARRGPT